MQEAKDPKSVETSGGGDDTSAESKEPGSDATSKETLSDLEEKEKVSGASGRESGGRSSSSAPSPDGAFDEGGGRGPREDPGPM